VKIKFYVPLFLSLFGVFKGFAQSSPDCLIGNREVGSPHEMMSRVSNLSVVGKNPGETLPWNYEPAMLEAIHYQILNPTFSAAMREENEFEYMQKDALHALVAMIDEARRAGIKIFAHSAYRPYKIQCSVFTRKVQAETETNRISLDEAIRSVNTRSALPGQSEHQLGTAVDLVTDIPNMGYKLEYEMQNTPAFKWLKANAFKFGFVLSFPADQMLDFRRPNPRTGYVYEPWHWRYIHPHYSTRFLGCTNMTAQGFLKAVSRNTAFSCK